MTGQEIATAVHHGIDPVILVVNNSMYGTIRMHQEREYPDRVIGTDLSNPDFVAWARELRRIRRTGRTHRASFPDAFDAAACRPVVRPSSSSVSTRS